MFRIIVPTIATTMLRLFVMTIILLTAIAVASSPVWIGILIYQSVFGT